MGTLQQSHRLRRPYALLLALLLFTATIILCRGRAPDERLGKVLELNGNPGNASVYKGIVMPRINEDIRWLSEFTPDWMMYIYSTSSWPKPGFLIPPATHGHESITYLTFITTYYERLPDYVLFLHASPDQWHNDVLGPYTSQILNAIRFENLEKYGYMNLRCTHVDGCPTSVNPNSPTDVDVANKDIRAYFAQAYRELFDVEDVPDQIGHVCCAQFAVSRRRILQRPKEDYERMLRWAIETELTDSFGVGWVFEKVWHIIFGMPPIHCPAYEQCRCDLFGWCV